MVELYLGFELKIAQENQVQEDLFADLSIDVWMKCSDNKFRLQGHLLMYGWCPNNEFRLQARSHMFGHIWRNRKFPPLGCPHMSRGIFLTKSFVGWVVR